MNKETQELLAQCKGAGYTIISIGVKDKRCPSSLEIGWYKDRRFGLGPSDGSYTGGIPLKDLDGNQTGWGDRPRVICGEPKCRKTGRPAIWGIIENIPWNGSGACGETHALRQGHPFELGVFENTDSGWVELDSNVFK